MPSIICRLFGHRLGWPVARSGARWAYCDRCAVEILQPSLEPSGAPRFDQAMIDGDALHPAPLHHVRHEGGRVARRVLDFPLRPARSAGDTARRAGRGGIDGGAA